MCAKMCTIYERCAHYYIRTNATISSQFNDKTVRRSLYQFSHATGVELFVSQFFHEQCLVLNLDRVHVKCVDIVRGCDKKYKKNIIKFFEFRKSAPRQTKLERIFQFNQPKK